MQQGHKLIPGGAQGGRFIEGEPRFEPGPKLIPGHGCAGASDNAERMGQAAGPVEIEKGRDELSGGQVAGSSEDDEGAGFEGRRDTTVIGRKARIGNPAGRRHGLGLRR